jgi:ABC-type transport system involved in cytochrome c biogenesis permease subunit
MNTPFSVHIVVALEWLFGILVGFFALMFLVFGFYGIIHFNPARILTSFGVAALMAAITWLSFAAGQGLRDGKSWAWRVSWGIEALVVLFGAWTIYEPLYAKAHSADDYFGLIVGPFLIVCALLGMILLLLRQTRDYFRA